MTDDGPFGPSDRTPEDDPGLEAEVASLAALLGDEAVWAEPTPGLEDVVVAAVRREVEAGDPGDASPHGDGQQPIDRPGPGADGRAEILPFEPRNRRWVGPLLGAAAALVIVAAFAIGTRLLDEDTPPEHLVAMVGTDLAPAAEATAAVDTTPLGTRIILDVTGLGPAPEGQYYEAWLRQSPEVGVSAGTFHLRGGDGAIELWAGVTVDDYPILTVTLQDEGAGAASSGRVVLRGRVDG